MWIIFCTLYFVKARKKYDSAFPVQGAGYFALALVECMNFQVVNIDILEDLMSNLVLYPIQLQDLLSSSVHFTSAIRALLQKVWHSGNLLKKLNADIEVTYVFLPEIWSKTLQIILRIIPYGKILKESMNYIDTTSFWFSPQWNQFIFTFLAGFVLGIVQSIPVWNIWFEHFMLNYFTIQSMLKIMLLSNLTLGNCRNKSQQHHLGNSLPVSSS